MCQFEPTATGTASGQLTIQSDSSTNSRAVVNLSGTGTAAAKSADLSIGSAQPRIRQCGDEPLPQRSPVTLTSTGTAPVTINSAALSGTGFTMSGATFPVTLNPGQTVTLSVQFEPTVTGAASGQLTIQSDSSTNSTAIVNLERHGDSGGKCAVDRQHGESYVRQCDGGYGLDAARNVDLYGDGAGYSEFGSVEWCRSSRCQARRFRLP